MTVDQQRSGALQAVLTRFDGNGWEHTHARVMVRPEDILVSWCAEDDGLGWDDCFKEFPTLEAFDLWLEELEAKCPS